MKPNIKITEHKSAVVDRQGKHTGEKIYEIEETIVVKSYVNRTMLENRKAELERELQKVEDQLKLIPAKKEE